MKITFFGITLKNTCFAILPKILGKVDFYITLRKIVFCQNLRKYQHFEETTLFLDNLEKRDLPISPLISAFRGKGFFYITLKNRFCQNLRKYQHFEENDVIFGLFRKPSFTHISVNISTKKNRVLLKSPKISTFRGKGRYF